MLDFRIHTFEKAEFWCIVDSTTILQQFAIRGLLLGPE